MFDVAKVGDTVVYCRRTFGLRPSEEWSEPTTVAAVQETHWGPIVTLENGLELDHQLHSMSTIYKSN